jgi:hypothetical protein
MTTITLNEAANKIQAHPRTILRAISGEPNPYWTDDHNPDISIVELAKAYECNIGIMQRVIDGRDMFLTPSQAASMLKIPDRTFRYRKYRSIRHGGIVRYSRAVLLQRNYKKWERDKGQW